MRNRKMTARTTKALEAVAAAVKAGMSFEPSAAALARWNPDIKAAPMQDDECEINIYDEIGENWQGTGLTPQSVSQTLSSAGGKDVVVNINSPGGSFFDGLAIYNLLKEYKGNVTIKVLGMAASAASVVAMAGSDIQISEYAFLMIHNSWTIAVGNSDDMMKTAAILEQFDESMCAVYTDATGIDEKDMCDMMDAETWISGKDAVEKGFASSLLGDKDVVESKSDSAYNATLRRVDVQLAKSGMPRSERRALIKEISGTPSAAKPATPSAGEDQEKLKTALASLLTALA